MAILSEIIRLALAITIAFIAGRLISRLKLPAILGWLITGIIIGPHALGLLNDGLLGSDWFNSAESLLECLFGIMIGSEMLWKQMKRSGPQIIVTTITESLGTFFVVSAIFGVIFYLTDVPIYLAFIFGGIALATAPAPSLSVVDSLKTDGPVTRTLIPMAALDDLVGALVFFLVIAFVSARISTVDIPIFLIISLVFLPVVIGGIVGFIFSKIMQKTKKASTTLTVMIIGLLLSAVIGHLINCTLDTSIINFMLIGMSYAIVFANMLEKEKLDAIMKVIDPIIGFSMIVVILNLAAPLDYHLIFSAGLYTAIYIIARAIGKYSGAYLGASLTHAPKTVQKYLGLTLLPHSGVSLVFTGIAVSVLQGNAPECVPIIQGTIAAAAVINEIIAVFLARQGFAWAGELHKAESRA